MIKNKLIIALSFLALTLTSCSDWLDVSPRSSIDGDNLLTTENGYKQALTGVYTLMAKTDLYGEATSMILPEALAQHWTQPSAATINKGVLIYNLNSYNYSYSSVETYLANTWKSYYKAIVQTNDILNSIENSDVLFSNNNEKLIKGEALGLRAFLHLDLLRLWGPLPSAPGSTKAIPYVTIVTNNISDLASISYSEIISKIISDLDEAEKILAEYDPLTKYSNEILNDRTNVGTDGPDDDWQYLRQGRFNYYAVLGTKARLYQWIGDKANATKYAKMVIHAVNNDNQPKFTLATNSYMSEKYKTYVFFCEHLFGVYNSNTATNAQIQFLDGTPPLLTNLTSSMALVFPESTTSDIRYTACGIWENREYNSNNYAVCRKYSGASYLSTTASFSNRTPLLRLSEMYLILMESLSLDEVKTTNYLADYISSRGMTSSLIDATVESEDALAKQLEKEYRKEFFAEGQMFYYYKRHEVTAFSWPSSRIVNPASFVLPKPDAQIKFE